MHQICAIEWVMTLDYFDMGPLHERRLHVTDCHLTRCSQVSTIAKERYECIKFKKPWPGITCTLDSDRYIDTYFRHTHICITGVLLAY